VARALQEKGFMLVRPLAGGLEAWVEAGYPVEVDELVAVRSSAEAGGPADP
jgi:3-mercaptopyruvate sulfurtransferase SseA